MFGLLFALMLAMPVVDARAEIVLTLNGDGATGVTVLATYAVDGRPFEQPLPLVLTGSAQDGRTVGPLPLALEAEGRGFYTAHGILTPGTWRIVVTAKEPQPLHAEVTVVARAAQTAPPPGMAAPAPQSGPPVWLWLAAAAVPIAGFLLWRFRFSR